MSIALLPLLLLLASPMLASCQLTVETDDAVYVGRLISYPPDLRQTVAHLGIPYAQPPVGALRFAPPVPWTPPRDTNTTDNSDNSDATDGSFAIKPELNATRAGPACLQRPDAAGTPGRMSEDCLYLNVHSPTIRPAPPSSGWPVLVWLHAGHFETGAIGDPDSGREFAWDLVARQPSLIFVETAYRLGVFGFLSHRGVGGNAGLLDQQAALTWVAKNIGFFGGDNGSVTLGGLDAGSASVGFHMLSPGSRNLFQRCAFFGGSPLAGWALVRDRPALERYHRDFYRLAGCHGNGEDDSGTLACLRNMSAAVLKALQADFDGASPTVDLVEFPPVVDGRFIDADPLEAFARGRFNAKPTMIGATSLEGAQLAYQVLRSGNVTDQSELIGQRHRDLVERTFRYLPRFPEQPPPLVRGFLTAQLTAYASEDAGRGNFALLIRALSQRVTVCDSNRFTDQLLNSSSSAPVFSYLLAEPDNKVDYAGAKHGRDAAYFFGEPLRRADYTDDQRTLSGQMMNQFVGFLTSGDLSQTGWNRTSRLGLQFFRFVAAPRSELVRGGFDRQDCRLWDEILPWLSDSGGRPDQSTMSGPPPVPTTASDAEAKFWERCNATVNTVSQIAIGIGGGAVLLLIVCVVLVARGRRRSSGQDSMELYQRVAPVSTFRKSP